MNPEVVIIGASWGGLHAVGEVLAPLPADFPLPVLVVQHRSEDGEDLLANLLARRTALTVCEADDKEALSPGSVHVAPRGYHVLVERDHLELSTEAAHHHSRPSIDLAFTTAAQAYGEGAVGVVLTGANADGAAGLTEVRRRGGMAIVQDPASAERDAMPRAAIAAADPQEVRPLEEIAPLLLALAQEVAR